MECAARGIGTPCAPGRPARRCGLCGAVAYCSRAHQTLHWTVHKEECGRLEEQMRRSDMLNDFPFTFPGEVEKDSRCSFLTSMGLHETRLWRSECICGSSVVPMSNSWLTDEWNLPSSLCPCSEPKDPLSCSLSCWKDYYHWRRLPFHSPVAMLLHWPLTIYYCFQLLTSQGLIPQVRDELRIHYLGSKSSRYKLLFEGPEKELLQLAVFGELQALFPGVLLHIEFIGPAVPQLRDGDAISLSNYLPCYDASCHCKLSCNTSGAENPHGSSTLNLKLHKGFYHERHSSILKDSYPHLIIAPNAGVAAYRSWLPTIEVIKEMGIPAIFTDYCEEAANLAASCIFTITGQPLKLPIQINPFRQPTAVENSALYLPCYSNCFLFGI